MARDGKTEDEIWPAIGERYKSTMAVVERQVFISSRFIFPSFHTLPCFC